MTEYYWWKSKKNINSDIFAYIKRIEHDQSYRNLDNQKNLRLYGNYDTPALKAFNFQRSEPSYNVQNRVTLNIVQSMVDTVTSKITKNKPRPMFLTSGGDWTQQRRAKKLTKFVEGQFSHLKMYDKGSIAFKDSAIFGTGVLKFFKKRGDIAVERVFPDEIVVDDADGMYGAPRQMHQKKFIHREVLKAAFPKYKEAIDVSGMDPYMQSYGESVNHKSDLLLVVESWHLPSGPDAKDGRHVISIENQALVDESWSKERFPFVFFRWSERPLGFFGQGLAEQLTGLQLEINKILRTIQVSMHLVSVPKIFVEASTKIVSAQLDNKIGGIIKFAGQPPTPGQLGTIPPELFAHLDRLYQRAYEIAGISQLSANSRKPSGLDSGKALREYNDLETERFMDVAKRYEQAYLDAAALIIDLAKELDEELDGGYQVKVSGKSWYDEIKWKDVNLYEDKYVMQAYPTSALSQTPAARLQEVQELLQAGFVTREEAIKLLNFPDLEGFYNIASAVGEDVDKQLETMIENSRYVGPEPYQNLEYARSKVQFAYLHYKANNAPDEVLELMRRYMEDCTALIEKRKKAEMALVAQSMPAPQVGGQPLGVPAPAPVSDMLPMQGVNV
ncbi:MAG: hypothetical protein FMNOHCHN_03729 [Ignavibacteriaceae bacterium]|nr:hypothetical protein [Ignavibacteriaceae bacterium]